MDNDVYDVAIVGYGPVGQLLAALLGRSGHRVIAIERYADFYPMPRAVHFDHEVARILQRVGIRADTSAIIEPYDDVYEWRNANGQTLLQIDWSGLGPSWWHVSNFFAQPDLERALDARAREHPSVELLRGTVIDGLAQHEDHVVLLTAAGSSVRARYVVGCDGANSTVRDLLGIERTDLGFFFDWLILDMLPKVPMTFDPPALQVCDPRRPTTVVPGGPGRRRWEFMALPGEDVNELNKEDRAWELLAPWGVTPKTADLERHTVYRFQACWAEGWRRGRVLLAGDAAHLMPPFAGQGMCGGLRDAANLAWKLDLVLGGKAPDTLLDTYETERSPHVQHFINQSIALGRVICVPDPDEAAGRDRQMTAVIADPTLAPPPPPEPRLGTGLLAEDDPRAGTLSIQSTIGYRGETGLFDDLLGHGWFVLTRDTDTDHTLLSAEARAVLDRLDARILRLADTAEAEATADTEAVVDIDGRYAKWLDDLGAHTVVIRPDFYLYAAITGTAEVGVVLERLAGQLNQEAYAR
jgi:2-polyprenyl-6-methoxyphenol hydroxylase-like FAD-dependent oxidoreductase